MHTPAWKTALIVIVCLGGLLFALPNVVPSRALPGFLPQQGVSLGLDLQGGSHLLLEVDRDAVVDERLETIQDEARLQLRQARIGYRGLRVEDGALRLSFVDPTQADQGLAILGEIETGLVVEHEATTATVRLSEDAENELVSSAVEQSLEIVRRRIDEVGTREPTIQRQGEDRILVQVPGVDNPEEIKALVGTTAKMTFHLVDPTLTAEEARGRPSVMVLPSADELRADGTPVEYVVRRRVEVSGEYLTNAQPTFDQNSQPAVSFTFDTTGARRFGRVTGENLGEILAIVLDGEVISAPRINGQIFGDGQITGNFTVPETTELATLLRAGALPAPLDVVEERTVGPDLGADSVRAGAIASVLALVLVAVFMVVYYGLFGVIAVAALALNLVLIAAALSALGATLTLPGIAGIVLTIGMAVDANVLIFERIREEARVGRSPIAATDVGYGEALRTIIDANITTLIAALMLFQFGTGPIRGFAVTLAIGILTSMFTAITLTKTLIAVWLRRNRPKNLPAGLRITARA